MFQEESEPGITYYNSYWGEKVRDNSFFSPSKSWVLPPPPHFLKSLKVPWLLYFLSINLSLPNLFYHAVLRIDYYDLKILQTCTIIEPVVLFYKLRNDKGEKTTLVPMGSFVISFWYICCLLLLRFLTISCLDIPVLIVRRGLGHILFIRTIFGFMG